MHDRLAALVANVSAMFPSLFTFDLLQSILIFPILAKKVHGRSLRRNGSASTLCGLQILVGEILFLLNPIQVAVSLYAEERFPLTLLLGLSKVTAEMWYYYPVRICLAIVGYWPGICFCATGISVLLWMMFFYGCGSVCLDGLAAQLRETAPTSPPKTRHKMVSHLILNSYAQ